LLGEHTAHRVTEQSWLRCDSFEKGLKLVEVVGQADPDESGALLVGTQAVAGQVWGMAGPTELLERGLELIENPAALIGAMDHHDVLGHGLCPLASSQVKPAWRSGMRGQGQAPPEETPGARAASSAPLSPASRCGTAIG
jgi:hypothetical protein